MIHLILLNFVVLHLLLVSCCKHANRTPNPKSEAKNQDAALKKDNNEVHFPNKDKKTAHTDIKKMNDDKKTEVNKNDNHANRKKMDQMKVVKLKEVGNNSETEKHVNVMGPELINEEEDREKEEAFEALLTKSQREKLQEMYGENKIRRQQIQKRMEKNEIFGVECVSDTQIRSSIDENDKNESVKKETLNNDKFKKCELSGKNGSRKENSKKSKKEELQ